MTWSEFEFTVRSIESPTGCDVDGRWAGRGWPSTTRPLHVQPAFSPRPPTLQPMFIPQATSRRPSTCPIAWDRKSLNPVNIQHAR